MTSFKALALAFLFVWASLPAQAIMPSQVKLLDSDVAPKCGAARASWMTVGDKGPAVSLANNCKAGMTIAALSRHGLNDADKTVDGAPLVLATKAQGYVQYIELTLKSGGAACFADAPPAKAEGLTCASVTLPPGDMLILPVAWGLHYTVTGAMANAAHVPVKASGWMINPANPQQMMDIIHHETAGLMPAP